MTEKQSANYIYGLLLGLTEQEKSWVKQQAESNFTNNHQEYLAGTADIRELYRAAVQHSLNEVDSNLISKQDIVETSNTNFHVITINYERDLQIELVYIPASQFVIGSMTEGEFCKPLVSVSCGEFYITRSLITEKEACALGIVNVPQPKNKPITGVSHVDVYKGCQSFIRKIREKSPDLSEVTVSLPTEIEWELALGGLNRKLVEPGQENVFYVKGAKLKEMVFDSWAPHHLSKA